ncbi:MAG: hypothetical protein HYX60_10365 [Legionella longbeachae]|nr:hypothetical protein [Legionella longbeachae]
MSINSEELQTIIAHDIPPTVDEDPKKEITLETIQTQLKIIDDKEQDGLKKIVITKEIFEQIRKSLTETVKSMEKNPSIFSRAAEFWGTLPLWKKILGGIALTVPTLILGIVANIGFLLAICGVTAVTYAAGGMILDDHHKCSSSIIESALNVIREQLEEEIQKFVKENERLSENINSLSEQIDFLDLQVKATVQITETISETKDGLDKAANSLKEGVLQQTDLLQQNQIKLSRITEAYKLNQSELENKILEIDNIKNTLKNEVENAHLTIKSLQASISELSNLAIGEEELRIAFKEKLELFINDKESRFDQLTDRIFDAENKLALVQKELENANSRYQELLQIQGQHIDRLEVLGNGKESSSKSLKFSKALGENGLYKVDKSMNMDSNKLVPNEVIQLN